MFLLQNTKPNIREQQQQQLVPAGRSFFTCHTYAGYSSGSRIFVKKKKKKKKKKKEKKAQKNPFRREILRT